MPPTRSRRETPARTRLLGSRPERPRVPRGGRTDRLRDRLTTVGVLADDAAGVLRDGRRLPKAGGPAHVSRGVVDGASARVMVRQKSHARAAAGPRDGVALE